MWEHKFNKTEVVCIAFACCISDYIFAVDTGDKHFTVCTYVNREILPSGFIVCFIYFRLVDYGNGILFVELSITVGIVPIKNTNPTMFVLIRNVCPETNRFSIFNNNSVVEEKVRLTITATWNTVCRNGVHFNFHGADTIVNLTVFRCCIAEVLIETFIVPVNVSDVPFIDIRRVFEIKENFRTFTKVKLCCCY